MPTPQHRSLPTSAPVTATQLSAIVPTSCFGGSSKLTTTPPGDRPYRKSRYNTRRVSHARLWVLSRLDFWAGAPDRKGDPILFLMTFLTGGWAIERPFNVAQFAVMLGVVFIEYLTCDAMIER